MSRESSLIEDEQHSEKGANGDETDDLWRVPGIGSTSKVQTQEYHYHDSHHGNTTCPVNGFDAFGELRPWVMHIQEDP